jgi:UDP-3-O-[3-hydroxymyristoyl] glucosamine N-acyltransferase
MNVPLEKHCTMVWDKWLSIVKIGTDCIIHPNAVIGADGFGFRPAPKEVHQNNSQ